MMKKSIVVGIMMVSMIAVPAFSQAASLIPCTGSTGGATSQGGPQEKECTFADFIQLIQNILDFFAFILSPIIAGLIFAYGGFLILTDGGSAERLKKAKKILLDALVGLLIVWGAWVIVRTMMVLLGYDTSIFPSFF